MTAKPRSSVHGRGPSQIAGRGRWRQRGAALAEYLPPLLFVLLVAIPAWARYGGELRQQIATAAERLADNYYHGWFWPEEEPLAGAPPSRPGRGDGGGPQPGDPLPGEPGGGLGGGSQFGDGHHGGGSGDPFTPDPGGAGSDGPLQCAAGTASGSGPSISPTGGNAQTYTQIGNPIDLGTGNKLQTETDYTSHRPDGLHVVRYYNSVLDDTDSGLGHGWRHSYQRAIAPDPDHNLTAVVWRDDGSQYRFEWRDGHWRAPLGIVERLAPVVNEEGSRVGWTYTTADGQVEHYRTDGRLSRIDHPAGPFQQLHYDSDGRLIRIADSRGDTITLQWRGQHLRRIDLPTGERLNYDYDDRFNLTAVRRGTGIGKRWAGLRTPERRYHYEDSRHPHALTGLDDATGQRFAIWAYDAVGRALSSEHGDGAERISLDYRDTDRATDYRQVTVTNALGHRATYTLEPARPGKWRLRSIDGQPGIDCAAVQKAHRYDERGFLRLQYGDGIARTYTRDARGRLIDERHGLHIDAHERVQPAPGAVRIQRQWVADTPWLAAETRASWQQDDDRQSPGDWQLLQRRSYTYDDRGRLTHLSARDLLTAGSEPRAWQHHYTFADAKRTRLSEHRLTDPRGHATIYTYNANEQLQAITNALGQVTRFDAYNRHGQPRRITLPDGQVLALTYNPAGLPTRLERHPAPSDRDRETPPREITTADYDAAGRLIYLKRPDGSTYRVSYNAAGQPTQIENGRGERIELTPNALHGQWEQQAVYRRGDNLPVQHHHRRFNALGQLSAMTGNADQKTAIDYDPHGNLIAIHQGHEDPAHAEHTRTTEARYDTLGRLLELIDAAGHTTHHSYGPAGGLASATDANGSTTGYERNGFGEVIRLTSPTTSTVLNRYDANGNLIAKAAEAATGSTIARTGREPANGPRFDYDPLDRPTHVDYPGEADDITYTYDQTGPEHGHGIGRLTRIDTATHTLAYRYDGLGRRIEETTREKDPTGTVTHTTTLGYHYLSGNRLSRITYPDGSEARYRYDDERIDRISYRDASSTISTILDNIAYAPFGGPVAWTYSNGLTQTKTLDRDGRITEITLHPERLGFPWSGQGTPDKPVWSQRYGYDLYQNIDSLTIDDTAHRYGYDAVDRLIQEISEESRIAYAYDPVGNRTQEVHGDNAITYTYAAGNQLVRRGDAPRLLDAVGSLIGERGLDSREPSHRGFVYGRNNLPIAYHADGRLIAHYRYNALGLRIAKERVTTNDRETTRYHYAPDTRLLAERQRDRATHYVWLGHTPVAAIRLDGGRVARVDYLHSDHLHTPRLATNGERRIVWRWNADAFGKGAPEEDPDNDGVPTELNLRFPGQYADVESGLHYNVLRYYDPRTGRYLQSDPIGLRGGINSYAYVDANPLSYVDPLGLFLFAFDGTGNDGGNLGGRNADAPTNVAHLTNRYLSANGQENIFYQAGVGTGSWPDPALGGATGWGSRNRVNTALKELQGLLDNVDWDRTIDIIGFSRGAAAAREFANEVFKRIDGGSWSELVTLCNPLNIRFMGLFDTVGSMGVPGNGDDIGYDLTIDDRIGKVAHAVALNEHRWLFPLSSVSPAAGASVTSGRVVEQGFIGAHSNIGGGYADSDLSDIALQWMYRQAGEAGVPLASLKAEHRIVTNPVIHDERRGELGVIIADQGDRAIYYPNDPFESTGRACERRDRGRCVQWEPINPAERQKTAPQFSTQDEMIQEDYNGNVRGTVDMEQYEAWLEQQGVQL